MHVYTGFTVKMLWALIDHPAGLSTPELTALVAHPGPHQRALTRCGNRLREQEGHRVRRAGVTPGAYQRGPAVVWRITEAGACDVLRLILDDLRKATSVSEIKKLGADAQRVIAALGFICAEDRQEASA